MLPIHVLFLFLVYVDKTDETEKTEKKKKDKKKKKTKSDKQSQSAGKQWFLYVGHVRNTIYPAHFVRVVGSKMF